MFFYVLCLILFKSQEINLKFNMIIRTCYDLILSDRSRNGKYKWFDWTSTFQLKVFSFGVAGPTHKALTTHTHTHPAVSMVSKKRTSSNSSSSKKRRDTIQKLERERATVSRERKGSGSGAEYTSILLSFAKVLGFFFFFVEIYPIGNRTGWDNTL